VRDVMIATLAVLSLLASGGCAGFFGTMCLRPLGLSGQAFEAPAGSKDSVVLIDAERLPIDGLRALEGCAVRLEALPLPSARQTTSATGRPSDAAGRFRAGTSMPAGDKGMLFSVTCPGFRTATRQLSDERRWYDAVTLLKATDTSEAEMPHNNELQRTRPAQAMEPRR
jgi:hypothetical protein